MSSDQSFNELGQILSQGGDIALGMAIARGWSSQQIALLFSRRFEPMRPEDRDRLTSHANQMVEAAKRIGLQLPDEVVDPEGIPTNPYLFGDEPEGRRATLVGRFSPDDGGKWFNVYADLADITDQESMLQAIQELAEANWNKYPEGNTKGFGGGPMTSLTIELTLIVKRY